MGEAVRASSKDIFVSWLPLYHDMGLIGAWLGSLYYAMPLVLMSPLAFLEPPQRWLWAIHEHRGDAVGGTQLCLRTLPQQGQGRGYRRTGPGLLALGLQRRRAGKRRHTGTLQPKVFSLGISKPEHDTGIRTGRGSGGTRLPSPSTGGLWWNASNVRSCWTSAKPFLPTRTTLIRWSWSPAGVRCPDIRSGLWMNGAENFRAERERSSSRAFRHQRLL